jgi:hypothetical protein
MRSAILLAAFAVLQLACGGLTPARQEGRISVRSEALVEGATIDRVAVELQPSGISNELSSDGSGAWTGTLVAPAGALTLTVRAYAGGALVAEGSADVVVVAGQTAAAVVALREVAGLPPADHGPFIRALTSTATTLLPGQHATLAVDAIDPDGDPLTYQWSRSCPTGVFESPAAAQTDFWSAAETGCTVTVAVSSGAFTATKSIALVVQGTGSSGQVEVSASFVPFPYVDYAYLYGITPAAPFTTYSFMISRTLTSACTYCFVTADATIPEPLFPGQVQQFSVVFANLPPGDPNGHGDLEVWMDDDCGGSATWSGTIINGNEAVFTWTAPPTAALCMVSAHVRHDGMHDALAMAAVVEGCVDDRLERSLIFPYPHNDDPAGATDAHTLGARVAGSEYPNAGQPVPSYAATGLWANDPDWFKFTANATATDFSAVVGSSDVIPLVLYAADGTTELASGENALAAALVPGASYYLKVGPGAAAATCGSAYGLELWARVPVP